MYNRKNWTLEEAKEDHDKNIITILKDNIKKCGKCKFGSMSYGILRCDVKSELVWFETLKATTCKYYMKKKEVR